MGDDSRKRHVVKTITWRFVGTIDTIILSWIISGDPLTALKIGGAEVVTKMLLYYCHERVWFKIKFGLGLNATSHLRHVFKSISWRIIGTIDTMLLAWIISGNAMTGLKIGLVEVVTKMVLYYLHERAWYKIDFGVENRRKKKNTVINE